MFECVVNIAEGRDAERLAALIEASGTSLANCHHDPWHHRSVFTLLNERDELVRDVRALATAAVAMLDLRTHSGVHPRFGVVDVVPFVPLGSATMAQAVALRQDTASWLASSLAIDCFLYGPDCPTGFVTLPEVRAALRAKARPDVPATAPTDERGAAAVGARPVLLAWNVWLEGASLADARAIARAIRAPEVRALGLAVGDTVQVSCNLVAPTTVGPWEVRRHIVDLLDGAAHIARCELVGLAPEAVLRALTPDQQRACDLSGERTIEAALAARGD